MLWRHIHSQSGIKFMWFRLPSPTPPISTVSEMQISPSLNGEITSIVSIPSFLSGVIRLVTNPLSASPLLISFVVSAWSLPSLWFCRGVTPIVSDKDGAAFFCIWFLWFVAGVLLEALATPFVCGKTKELTWLCNQSRNIVGRCNCSRTHFRLSLQESNFTETAAFTV